MIRLFKSAALLFMLATVPCQAQWYETEGTAQIRNGDTAQARIKATDEAIRQAMLESGSFVSTTQNMTDGVYGDDFFNITSNNNIKQYSLISEKRHNGFLTVKIRVFMDEEPTSCTGKSYRKAVMPILFVYGEQQYQASENGLEGINTWLTSQFTQELKNNPTNITTPFYNKNTGIDPARTNTSTEKLATTIRHIARTQDVQFVSFGVIRDLAKHKEDSSWLKQNFGDDYREISFDIYVYDGLTAQEVFHSNYHHTSKWDLGSPVNLYSEFFAQSAYGFAAKQLIKKAAADVSSTISCLNPTGRVLNTDAEGYVYINLGRKHKVRQGTRFYLEQSSYFQDNDELPRNNLERAQAIYKVEKVFENTAVLKSVGLPDGNIQPDDLAVAE